MIRGSWNRKCSVQMSSLSLAVSCGTISRSLNPVRWARRSEGDGQRAEARNDERTPRQHGRLRTTKGWLAVRMTSIDDNHRRKAIQGILSVPAQLPNCCRACPIVRTSPPPFPPPRSGEGEESKSPPLRFGEGGLGGEVLPSNRRQNLSPPGPPPRSGEGEESRAPLSASERGVGGRGFAVQPLQFPAPRGTISSSLPCGNHQMSGGKAPRLPPSQSRSHRPTRRKLGGASPHYEFPLSSIGSVAMHIGMLAVFVGLLYLLSKFTISDNVAPPVRVMSLVGDGDGPEGAGTGGGDRPENDQQLDVPMDP